MSKGLAYYLQNEAQSKELSPESLNAWIHKYAYCQSLHLLKGAKDYEKTNMAKEEDLLYSTNKNHWISQMHDGFSELSDEYHPPIQIEQHAANLYSQKAPEQIEKSTKPTSVQTKIAEETKASGPASEDNTEIKVVPLEQKPESSIEETVYPESDLPEIQPANKEIAVKDLSQYEVEEKVEEIPSSTSVSTNVQATKIFTPQIEDEEIVLSPFAQWLLSKKHKPTPMEALETSVPEDISEAELEESQDNLQGVQSTEHEEASSIQPAKEDEKTSKNVDIEEVEEEPKPDKVGQQKKDSIHDSVQQSNVIRQNIASETLAKLLWEQGHKDLAIKMYEKLILTNPEKSGFFAAQIKKLRST